VGAARRWVSAAAVLGVTLAGCSASGATTADRPADRSGAAGADHPGATPTGGAADPAPGAGGTKYERAVDAAAARHLSVWLEADLVRRWREGDAALSRAVATLAQLGKRPGVVGVKIADELGYGDGLDSQDEVLAFLREASPAVRRALPGKRVLIDMVVPELGCMPGVPAVADRSATCAATVRQRWPGATTAVASAVVGSGDIDVLDLSTGLREDSEYASWGTDRDTAQRAAWAEVGRLGWAGQVRLQARKALAQVGGYQGDDEQAAAALRTWIDIPLDSGAQAVDVWTWRQPYQDGTAMLMDAGLRSNALWRGLLSRAADRPNLVTHFSPSSIELGLTEDLDRLAQVFGTVFVAAGTG
jgi:hypothetical protein